MAITGSTNNQTKYFTSGNDIKFSDIKAVFNSNAANTNIKFSTYRRNTDLDETNPIVPDSTENRTTISSTEGISTNNDLRAASFVGSIKEYIVTQHSTNTNLSINNVTDSTNNLDGWNTNLNKNVRKKFIVGGTISATSSTADAATFNAEAYNLTLSVGGNIYGEGGDGGSPNGGNGSNGGDALYVNNTSTRSGTSAKLTVRVNSNGRIWAGGGGGASGYAGNSGNSLNCYQTTKERRNIYSGDSTTPSRACNRNCGGKDGWKLIDNGYCNPTGDNRSRCRKNMERGTACTGNYVRNCTYKQNFIVGPGNGGNGGYGGHGKGASTQNFSTNGNLGNPGNTNNCSANGNSSIGNDGNPGASGGDWGQPGGNSGGSPAVAYGGNAGRAIYKGNGNTYYVNGSSNNNIKGAVLGSA